MQENATSEHRWLQQLVGEWTFESTCFMGPDQPPMVTTGTDRVRPLGDLWVIAEGTGGTPDGSTMHSVMTLGFSTQERRFVGTFVADCMSHLWPYEGTLDPSGTVLTLASRGPSFATPGAMADYRDIVEMHPDGRRLLRSQFQGPDGAWTEFMVVRYTRVK
jgi:hypothetical protein